MIFTTDYPAFNGSSDLLIASWLLATVFFILGTAVGSFLNVWSRRLLRGEPVTGRSRCEHCGHVLSPIELIPLLSFLILRGRCRWCHQPLSLQYPLVELGTGILFAAIGFKFLDCFSHWWCLMSAVFLLASSSALIVIFLTDFLSQKIFDQVIIVGIVSAFAYRALIHVSEPLGLIYDLLGALGAFLFFLLIRSVTRGRGLGEGDPPLEFFAALLVGVPLVLVQLFLSFIFGSIVGIILVAAEKKNLKDHIAFAPFIVSATFATILAGDYIWSWYLNRLGF